tara:strand:- start:1714 stop:2874 length:1161 start_codon:yes stop_codon:yes gene_type:complete
LSENLPTTAEIVILGGGVMGASTAYHLCKAGFKKVVLLERESFFGTGATGRCAGGIRHQFNTEINIRLSQLSLRMLDTLEEETGTAAQVRKCGYLFVLTREADVVSFQKTVSLQNRLGVETEWLNREEVRTLAHPCVFEDAIAGSFNAEDGLADPHSVVSAYIDASRHLGACCLTGCNATGIKTRGNKIINVQTNRGVIETEKVVNACGPWSQVPAKWLGLDLPVQPLLRQWLMTNEIPQFPKSFPFVIDFAASLYFHREGPGILTGMSNPHQPFGEDQNIDTEWENNHVEKAVQRMPLLAEAGIQARQAGLYEMTPDSHPIIGQTPVDGFFLLTGFSGHGFMQGPFCGKLLSELITEGMTKSLDISSLAFDRFEKDQLIQEYNVV